MEARIRRRLEAFERATRLCQEHPPTPALPRVTALADELQSIITALYDYHSDQHFGSAESRSGVTIRRHRAAELLELLRSVNRIVRALDPVQFPGLREKFSMPRGDGYERLLGRASAFASAAEPVRDALIERGLDADFIEQILAKRDELVAATSIKHTGRSRQVGGTAGLAAFTRRGMQLLRELDAILQHQFRRDASLLAAWKSAARVHRDPQREPEESTTPIASIPETANTPSVPLALSPTPHPGAPPLPAQSVPVSEIPPS